MKKKRAKSSWEIEREQQKAQQDALEKRVDSIVGELTQLANDLLPRGKVYPQLRIDTRQRMFVESAVYQMRRLRVGDGRR